MLLNSFSRSVLTSQCGVINLFIRIARFRLPMVLFSRDVKRYFLIEKGNGVFCFKLRIDQKGLKRDG